MAVTKGAAFEHPNATSAKPHYLSYATARTVADDGLFEVWNGPTNSSRVLKLNKDGDLNVAGRLVAGSMAPAQAGRFQNVLTGAFTSDGSSTACGAVYINTTVTAVNGVTSVQAGLWVDTNIVTQDNSETVAIVATLYVDEPSITIGSDTVTSATAVYISRAPTEGTNNYALWVDDGAVRIDQGVALGGGAAPTLGTIGGSGPASAGQAQWLEINIAGTPHWVPAWT